MPVANITKKARYYVSNPVTGMVSILDGKKNSVISIKNVGVGASSVVATKDNTIYVANKNNNTVNIISMDGSQRTLFVKNNGNIDVDVISGRLYAADLKGVSVYDIASSTLIYSMKGVDSPKTIKLTKSRGRILVLDKDTVKIFCTITFDLLRTIYIGHETHYVVVNEDDSRAYVSYSDSKSAGITIIDLINNCKLTSLTNSMSLSNPDGMAINENILYVTNNIEIGNIVKIDTVTNMIMPFTDTQSSPTRLVVSPDKKFMYVTCREAGDVDVVDLIHEENTGVSIKAGKGIYDIAAIPFNSPFSTSHPVDLTDSEEIQSIKESACIIVKKVFANCQDRVCIPSIITDKIDSLKGPYKFKKIIFKKGFITKNSLIETPIKSRPNFSRVQFSLEIPYELFCIDKDGNEVSIKGMIDGIDKDIVLFIPKSRPEFDFEISVDTRTEILNTPQFSQDSFEFAIGSFLTVKVTGDVELVVPAFGYSFDPPEVENYVEPEEADVCKQFTDLTETPFPQDFFPPQYEDVKNNI